MKETSIKIKLDPETVKALEAALPSDYPTRAKLIRAFMAGFIRHPAHMAKALLDTGARDEQIPHHEEKGFMLRIESDRLADFDAAAASVFHNRAQVLRAFVAAMLANQPATLEAIRHAMYAPQSATHPVDDVCLQDTHT